MLRRFRPPILGAMPLPPVTYPRSVLMVFVDGIGLGQDDPDVNPLAVDRPGLLAISGGERWVAGAPRQSRSPRDPWTCFREVDACLGVEGFPQSGTGQATLFTGVNCARLAGRHYGPFPHSTSRDTLRTHSVFSRVGASECAFANAFPPRFFEVMRLRDRWPTTTRACLDAGVRIRNLLDLDQGLAVSADLTGSGLRGLGLDVKVVTPAHSGRSALRLASACRFTLVEVFHTDRAGHSRDRSAADRVLGDLDTFVDTLIRERPDDLLVVLTSDHGNLEDLTVRTHTRNPVPLAALGPGAGLFASASSLVDVTPLVADLLRGPTPGNQSAFSPRESGN